MKAVRLHQFGSPRNLIVEDVPDPVPQEGQVRIRVEASGVHVIDTLIRAGGNGAPVPQDLPAILGRDVAGVVEAVGEGVEETWIGERVVAYLGAAGGGYAERALAQAEALHRISPQLDAAAAVAMIGTGRTAVGILDAAALTADDAVLVTAAAGGLGTLFVQAARRAGSVVIGVAGGPTKVEQVRRNGAHVAIDYSVAGWPQQVRDALGEQEVSVVLDGVGGDLGRAAMELLRPGGRLLMFGHSSGTPIPFTSDDVIERGLTTSWVIFSILRAPGGLRALERRALDEAAAGRLLPAVQRYSLEQAARGHEDLENRATTGKVVLVSS
ncbi:oxidoreductase [Actinobacteria bacterium YIM 96077]|uniref:Oxidoreductase n=1 Tax=Phytoactinopolyspora halophila TaxID=1981511 RepID=A0A329R0K7_9ACTN|nr:zinc-binding dehydrogenase [Phytoactinopolyspora halophila]AYY15117.1 oxidoreductase [Actinobacteria bacterium YIM 96077]RAW18131.1 oxidoreductase [Phytoactinopolyspora halophila]